MFVNFSLNCLFILWLLFGSARLFGFFGFFSRRSLLWATASTTSTSSPGNILQKNIYNYISNILTKMGTLLQQNSSNLYLLSSLGFFPSPSSCDLQYPLDVLGLSWQVVHWAHQYALASQPLASHHPRRPCGDGHVPS